MYRVETSFTHEALATTALWFEKETSAVSRALGGGSPDSLCFPIQHHTPDTHVPLAISITSRVKTGPKGTAAEIDLLLLTRQPP